MWMFCTAGQWVWWLGTGFIDDRMLWGLRWVVTEMFLFVTLGTGMCGVFWAMAVLNRIDVAAVAGARLADRLIFRCWL